MLRNARLNAIISLLLISASAPSVWAGSSTEGTDPLDGKPAVRHRRELRSMRFEIGPTLGSTLGRSYRHAVMLGGKAQFHMTSYLAIGAEFQYGLSYDTGLTSEIESTYSRDKNGFSERHDRLSNIQLAGDARLVFTPFSGKLAIFSALFLAYDFYVFGGFGMGILKNNTEEETVDEANEGFKPGVAWGVGVHLFANQFVAIGLELKDLIFSDNETGGDLTRGLSDKDPQNPPFGPARADDTSFSNHFFLGLNVTFLLPTEAKITD